LRIPATLTSPSLDPSGKGRVLDLHLLSKSRPLMPLCSKASNITSRRLADMRTRFCELTKARCLWAPCLGCC
jgi:hypothetical protein